MLRRPPKPPRRKNPYTMRQSWANMRRERTKTKTGQFVFNIFDGFGRGMWDDVRIVYKGRHRGKG